MHDLYNYLPKRMYTYKKKKKKLKYTKINKRATYI